MSWLRYVQFPQVPCRRRHKWPAEWDYSPLHRVAWKRCRSCNEIRTRPMTDQELEQWKANAKAEIDRTIAKAFDTRQEKP